VAQTFGLRGSLIVRAPFSQQQPREKEGAGAFNLHLADFYHAAPGPVRMWDSFCLFGKVYCVTVP
jgi:hypothetical protein